MAGKPSVGAARLKAQGCRFDPAPAFWDGRHRVLGMVAELDYAFVAEYAKAELGKLTVVGASYTKVRVASFPAGHLLAVAGRLRAPEDVDTIAALVRIKTPSVNSPLLEFRLELHPGPESDRYDGKVAILFALNTSLILTEPGLCEITFDVDGVRQRRLAFEVVGPGQ